MNAALLNAVNPPLGDGDGGGGGAHKSARSPARKHPHNALAVQAPSSPASFLGQPVA